MSILLLYKYSSYDYRVIFFMSKCVYIFLGHSVFYNRDVWKKMAKQASGSSYVDKLVLWSLKDQQHCKIQGYSK